MLDSSSKTKLPSHIKCKSGIAFRKFSREKRDELECIPMVKGSRDEFYVACDHGYTQKQCSFIESSSKDLHKHQDDVTACPSTCCSFGLIF